LDSTPHYTSLKKIIDNFLFTVSWFWNTFLLHPYTVLKLTHFPGFHITQWFSGTHYSWITRDTYVFSVFRRCHTFVFLSYESSLTAGEGDVSHLRLRRGMSEDVRPTNTCNGE
jgi:hypothetical protein